jgi:hypothetical protein
MDTVTLVDGLIEDGQRLLDRLADDGFDFRAACWVKPVDEGRWSLFIAAPAIDEIGASAAYRKVYAALRSLGESWVTDSDIKLISMRHPVAQDALDILQDSLGRTTMFFQPSLFGGITVEQVYVYPADKRKEVTIYGLTFRGDPSGLLHLSLEPHNPHSKFITEGMGQINEYPAETGIDWVVAIPEGATLSRSNNIGLPEVVWNFRGNPMHSSANEVLSLAKLGLHGFRVLRQPNMIPVK